LPHAFKEADITDLLVTERAFYKLYCDLKVPQNFQAQQAGERGEGVAGTSAQPGHHLQKRERKSFGNLIFLVRTRAGAGPSDPSSCAIASLIVSQAWYFY